MQKKKRIHKIYLQLSMIFMAAFMACGCTKQEQTVEVPVTKTSQSIDSPLQGQGTKEDPFQIGSLENLESFAQSVNEGNSYGEQYVMLTKDIDMASLENWSMIGSADGSRT